MRTDCPAERYIAFRAGRHSATAGAQDIRKYGCGTCHTIPGVTGANGLVGPPLGSLGKQMYVAGELSNTTEHLMLWIQHPTSVNKRTMMPEMGVTEQDARDIAALVYSTK